MENVLNVLNIININMSIPVSTAVTSIRVPGDEKVFKPVSAVFCDSKVFSTFQASRRRLERLCMANGTKLCGGFAIPDEKLSSVLEQIKLEKNRFEQLKADLVSVWPQPVYDWIKDHPEEENIILKVALSKNEVSAKLGFDVQVFKLNPSSEAMMAAGVEDGVQKQLAGAGSQILREISTEAANAWKTRKERGSSNQEVRKSLKRWADKLRTLSFLDTRLLEVEKTVRAGIEALPPTGKIEGRDFLALSGLMSLLSSPESIMQDVSMWDIGIEDKSLVPEKPESILDW